MADVTVKVGFQNRYRVTGINAAGNPAALDPTTALVLALVNGGGTIVQSSTDPLGFVVTSETSVGAVSNFTVDADADPDAGTRAIQLAIASTTTRNSQDDAVTAGLEVVGEEPLGTPA